VEIHIVVKGDTLWKIARQYGIPFEELKRANAHLAKSEYIVPGMKIFLPNKVHGGKQEHPGKGKVPVKPTHPTAPPTHQKPTQPTHPPPAPPVQQHMIQAFTATFCRLDENTQIVLHFVLPNILAEELWS